MKESISTFLETEQPKELLNALAIVCVSAVDKNYISACSQVISLFSPPLHMSSLRFLPTLLHIASNQNRSLNQLFEGCLRSYFAYKHLNSRKPLFFEDEAKCSENGPEEGTAVEVDMILHETEYLRVLSTLFDQHQSGESSTWNICLLI